MTTLTFHLARALGRRWGPGDEIVVTELDHHANVDPWRALERERGVDHPGRQDDPRDRATRPGRPGPADQRPDPARGDRGGVQRPGDDQRRGRGRRPGPRRGCPGVRRCRPLRPAPAGRCPGHRLRLPGLLGVQVLRAARRGPLRQARPAPGPRRAQAPAGPRHRPGAAGDRHPEPRGDRRRGGGGRVPGLARRRASAPGSGFRTTFDVLHRRGAALVDRLLRG